MVDIIVVLIVVVLLGFALKGSIKHFKGDSPCCGGGGGTVVLDIPDKKLDKPSFLMTANLTRNRLEESSKMPDTEL